ncbi:hypothetical protein DAPPUDRAFT_233861 [Daphnia pulex]|uniref:Uncharacterized protein n=1 Tax=Daphnia pulex TaxID=6669 RepID=E9FVY4_DAPPU|nr:hypothetical protein DAPPUDRAFT_233861 [Daphnia pulex]|eukprot:EFX89019.1 hypothetical protein DAPPUDRAFT_233861 [Daphnia pulex]
MCRPYDPGDDYGKTSRYEEKDVSSCAAAKKKKKKKKKEREMDSSFLFSTF